MITSNIIHRVLFVRYENSCGTGFTIEVDGKQYLISARHIFTNNNLETTLSGVNQLKIFSQGMWKEILVVPLNMEFDGQDIAVFAVAEQLTPILPAPPMSQNSVYGQDVYFLGFPFNFTWGEGVANFGKPFPIVKKGILATIPIRDMNEMFYIDGMNNKGFSGGPVVFKPQGSSQFSIAGVVSGYRPNEEPILWNGQRTALFFRENTGLTICFSIDRAVNIIKNNPIGFNVSEG